MAGGASGFGEDWVRVGEKYQPIAGFIPSSYKKVEAGNNL